MAVRVPRQQRAQERRDALLAAAVTVLDEHGPGAFTARAVAAAADLPLAAVSYYFPTLDDLQAAATEAVLLGWIEHGEAIAAAVAAATPAIDSGTSTATADEVDSAAEAITAALLPPGPPAAVLHRYDHLLAAARSPVGAAALASLRPALEDLVARILTGTRTASVLTPDAIVALIDGAAVGALAEGVPDPRARVKRLVRQALRPAGQATSQPSQSSNERPDSRS